MTMVFPSRVAQLYLHKGGRWYSIDQLHIASMSSLPCTLDNEKQGGRNMPRISTFASKKTHILGLSVKSGD
jgi:hypothetical protein